MSHQENITRIKAVYNALGPLKDKVVFVGGATISLYREGNSPEVRATEDVDIVIEIWQYGNYAALEEQFRSIGFENDKASGVICRFKYGQNEWIEAHIDFRSPSNTEYIVDQIRKFVST